MFDKLDEVVSLYEKMETELSSPKVISNQKLFQKLSKQHNYLTPIVQTFRELRGFRQSITENEEMIQNESGELKELALAENKELKPKIEELEQRLRVLLLPIDPNDDKNIMVEVRAGAGGDEAGIFAGELYRMYTKFAENNRWSIEPMNISLNSVGGFKEVIFMVKGEKVYSKMKYESGVHRVQRVPQTETQGRVHTSTVTVAVLPEAEDVEVNIDPSELRIDVFRSSGPGGQSVNTTDSAVRITHLPTNLVVTCQDEKSQHKNKAKAFKILKTRLLDQIQREQQAKMSADRKSMVGSGDRSEKIRTYNFPQGRITDHRISATIHQMDDYMGGNIEPILDQLASHYETEALKSHSVESTLSDLTSDLDKAK